MQNFRFVLFFVPFFFVLVSAWIHFLPIGPTKFESERKIEELRVEKKTVYRSNSESYVSNNKLDSPVNRYQSNCVQSKSKP